MRDYVCISLYTAARKGNVLAMAWKDINWEKKTWEIPNTKNGKPHVIPLLPPAIDILERRKKEADTKEIISEWVFPSPRKSKTGHLQEPKKAWNKIINKAKIENLRIHDLRRTLASWMASENIDTNIIGKTLGHKSIKSTLIYARLNVKAVRTHMEQALEGKIPIIQ